MSGRVYSFLCQSSWWQESMTDQPTTLELEAHRPANRTNAKRTDEPRALQATVLHSCVRVVLFFKAMT